MSDFGKVLVTIYLPNRNILAILPLFLRLSKRHSRREDESDEDGGSRSKKLSHGCGVG
jgi:hypothetical protein